MFCPYGFALFDDVAASLRAIARERFPFSNPENPAADMQDFYGVSETREKEVDRLLELFFAKCPSLSLASPRNEIVRVIWIIGKKGERSPREGKGESWLFLDPATWTVSTKAYFFRTAEAERKLQAIWPDASSVMIPEEIEDEVWNLMGITHYEAQAKIFAAFEGWAVTCKLEDSRPDSDWLRKAANIPPSSPNDLNTSLASVARQIVALYDSNPGLTKSSARGEFSTRLSARQFDVAWVRATEARPALSRPGRKPSAL